MTEFIVELLRKWREQDVPMLRARHALEAAGTTEALAAELEQRYETFLRDRLTIDEAAAASGYHRDHITRLIAEGRLENVGARRAPRVLRSELPRKPNPKPTKHEPSRPDLLVRAGHLSSADEEGNASQSRKRLR